MGSLKVSMLCRFLLSANGAFHLFVVVVVVVSLLMAYCIFLLFLQSLNGVYVNNTKLTPRTATTIEPGDEICFGVNIDTNELRYSLTTDRRRRPILRKHNSDDTSQPSSQESESSQGSGVSSLHGSPTKKPRTSMEDPIAAEQPKKTKESKPEKLDPERMETSEPVQKKLLPPSPAVSTQPGSTINVDDIFPDEIDNKESLSQAIFGDVAAPESSRSERWLGVDATTIQIQLAKEQLDKEKNKLLSNIEALKSELAAKEQLLAEREAVTENTKSANNSMLVSMQEEFTCVICQELFIRTFTLPCSHSFCEWCIKEWMKGKRQQDCPVCRKKITSDPVHSLALDNAISKIEEKLEPEERKQREEVKESHHKALLKLTLASTSRAGTTTSAPTSRTATTHSTRVTRAAPTTPAPIHPVVVSSPPPPSTTSRPIVISDTEDTFSSSDTDDDLSSSDESVDSSDSDSYEEGFPGAAYGGFGYCYTCGELHACYIGWSCVSLTD